jgi:hypothetical protein
MEKLTITIDGQKFADFESFVRIAAEALSEHGDPWWNGNLDALDEILDSVPGTYRIVWERSDFSRHCLGHAAMVNWLIANLKYCHPSNVLAVAERLRKARLEEGPTLFDWLVEIIREHKQIELLLK